MKKLLFLISISATVLLTACRQDRYLDLTSGEYINVEQDKNTAGW